MQKSYSFHIFAKTRFYLSYIYYNLRIPLDCKKGRLSIIIIELLRILGSATKRTLPVPAKLFTATVITKFGKFTIDPGWVDIQIVSPAFERLDLELFLSLIKKALARQQKVLVLDVGAHFGLYSVAIGNACKKYNNLAIYAFEPDSLFFGNGFSLLKTNLKDNKIKNYKVFHTGLGCKNALQPNKLGVLTKKLDSLIKPQQIKKYDIIFIKIDIDGYEREALEGARNFIAHAPKIVLLIEDCVDPKIIGYLKKDFAFYKKITPYNSFWIKK